MNRKAAGNRKCDAGGRRPSGSCGRLSSSSGAAGSSEQSGAAAVGANRDPAAAHPAQLASSSVTNDRWCFVALETLKDKNTRGRSTESRPDVLQKVENISQTSLQEAE